MWWMVTWPVLASIALAAGWYALSLRRRPAMPSGLRWVTAPAAGIAALVVITFAYADPLSLYVEWPRWLTISRQASRFVLPLALGIIIVLSIGLPQPRRDDAASAAHLAPRTWRSFVSLPWIAAMLGVAAVVVGLSLAAGFASEPDEQGRYQAYTVDYGSASAGTGIYGWYLSAVPLVFLGLLLAATWWALAAIARPPFRGDAAADAAARRLRSANVARVALGAAFLHLKVVLASLAATSMMSMTVSTGSGTYFRGGVPFASLTGVLQLSASIIGVIGLALWVTTALTALAPHRTPATVQQSLARRIGSAAS